MKMLATDYDPFLEVDNNSLSKVTPDEYSLKIDDLFLVKPISLFHKVQITNQDKDVTIMTTDPFQKDLLQTIQTYPASYRGQIKPESTAACHLVARKLQDTYNPEKKRFTRRGFLDNDYLGVIASETSIGNGLVAFGPAWVLEAVADYVKHKYNYGIVRDAALREEILEMNSDWRSNPGLLPDQFVVDSENRTVPKSELFQFDQVRVYQFSDRNFLDENGNLLQHYMIFAPVNVDEMERVLLYLHRNIQLYSFRHTIAIEDLPLQTGLDFKYLFPVDVSYLGNYTIIGTTEISQDRLHQIFNLQIVPFSFPRIQDILGAYATFLLAEALFYQFELIWIQQSLYVGMAGWIQAHDIYEQFGLILNDIAREEIRFRKLKSYTEAVQYAEQTNAKCFYYLGDYYAAMHGDDVINESISPKIDVDIDSGLFETINPLRAVVHEKYKTQAKRYLAKLGYDPSQDKQEYFIDLKLGYRTYQIEDDVVTVYYYKSTHDQEYQVYKIYGKHDPEIKEKLEKLLQEGYFFDEYTLNLTRGYPEFIPSRPPQLNSLRQSGQL